MQCFVTTISGGILALLSCRASYANGRASVVEHVYGSYHFLILHCIKGLLEVGLNIFDMLTTHRYTNLVFRDA